MTILVVDNVLGSTGHAGLHGLSAVALGEVRDLVGASSLRTLGVAGLESTGLEGALDVEGVPDLVEGAALAADDDVGAVLGAQSLLDIGQGVLLAGRGGDAGGVEPLVGGEALEELDSAGEEVDGLVTGLVVGVARGVEGGNAGSVLSPLV